MSAATDIVNWSGDRPAWQRDALRCLVLRGTISRQDVNDLVRMAKEQHGLVGEEPPLQCEPLCADHLPVADAAQPISLISISDAQSVNALAPGQSLAFLPGGLTVVYGDNGSGKSGYVRILRKLCRARAAEEPLLPNVFEPEPVGSPRATVTYGCGANRAEFVWEQGVVPPDDLSAVSIFDSSSAAVYVSKENDVTYVPFGLDLLPKLVDICQEIRQALQSEKSLHPSELDVFPSELEGTPSGERLQAISKDTSADDVDALRSFTGEDAARKEYLERVLAEQQPEQRAAEVAAKTKRYERLRDALGDLTGVITSEHLKQLLEAARQWREAEVAAAAAAEQLAHTLPTEVTTSISWRTLWQAAEAYFRESHRDHEATLNGSAERCPLCQQFLDDDAQARLTAFAGYFHAKASDEEASRREDFQNRLESFSDLDLDEATYRDLVEELRIDDPALADLVDSYIVSCRGVQDFAKTLAHEANQQEPPPEVPSLDIQPLTETIHLLRVYERGLIAASDPQASGRLRDEGHELAARKWLSDHRQQIDGEIERLRICSRFDAAISDTVTTGITAKVTELTTTYVTEELRASFEEELAALTNVRLRVELVARPGELGVSYYRLQLVGAGVHETNIDGVLSEGEKRAIGLAAFLSELSTEESKSAVVFDDPISSLDLRNRERVARRLITLAAERQVVVFTHDLFFLMALLDLAKKAHVPTGSLMLEVLPTGCGHVHEDVPWVIQKLTAQIGALRQRCVEARGVTDVQTFGSLIKAICADFREAIERSVEEVLLQDIVRRYRRQLLVSKVLDLQAIEIDDLTLLDELMSDYSSFEHFQEPESAAPLPDVERIERDLTRLDDWRRAYEEKLRRLRG